MSLIVACLIAAVVIAAVVIAAVVLAGACREICREAGRAAREETTLRAALQAHAEDMTQLIATLPPDQVPAALKKWQHRQ